MNGEAGVSTEPDRETVATSTEEYESRRKPTVRIRRFFRKGGLYIAGALITAIIGTYITNYSSRANLKVFLTSVSIDSPTLDSLMFERALREQQGLYGYGSKFTRNARLVEISNDSDWLPSLEGGTFDSYLTTVYQVRRRAGNASEQIQALRNGLEKWPKVVTELNLEIVYGILRDHSDAVEATMFGEIRTNRPVFSGSPPALDNKKAFYAVNTDDDGDIYVDDDKRRIPILWSEACDGDGDKKKEQCHQAALRLANSIAYFVADDLAQLKNLLDRTIMDLSHLSEASRESEIEIERFSYWRVTVTLTNNGKDPIAVSPWATMLVQPPAANKPNNSIRSFPRLSR